MSEKRKRVAVVHYVAAHDPASPPEAVFCGAKAFEGATSAPELVTCRNCLRRLPPAPVEFTPRYHTNETLQPCPECRPINAPACLDCARIASGSTETPPCCEACLTKASNPCATCGDVRLVYVTGTPSTENDAPNP